LLKHEIPIEIMLACFRWIHPDRL